MKFLGAVHRVRSVWSRIADRNAAGSPVPSQSRVCFLGDGCSGSWRIRAEQVADCVEQWRALPTRLLNERLADQFDVFCFVKRLDAALASELRARGKTVVYDLVDPWKQPDDGLTYQTLEEVLAFWQVILSGLPVDGVIFPNWTMRNDLGHLVPNAVTIYHHSRPRLKPITIRRRAKRVGYEGRAEYLGPWRESMERVCSALGLRFVINPRSLGDVDIGFAARGGPHGTLMPKRYKSNVKLANMLALGLPAVAHAGEAGFTETDPGGVAYFDTEEQLYEQLRDLLPWERRMQIHHAFVAHRWPFHIAEIVRQYEEYFLTVRASKALAPDCWLETAENAATQRLAPMPLADKTSTGMDEKTLSRLTAVPL